LPFAIAAHSISNKRKKLQKKVLSCYKTGGFTGLKDKINCKAEKAGIQVIIE